jgi:hypothetical protein
MKSEFLLFALTSALALTCTSSVAQETRIGHGPYKGPIASGGNNLDNPDWAEEQVAPPPAFSTEHLIMLDMPQQVTVKVGVDPETIVVGGDGVVRYVIVMRNTSGSTSAVYEGIRCVSDEVKTYARLNSAGEWKMVTTQDWFPLNDSMRSQHAKTFARQGGCQNRLATSKQEIITALKLVRKPTLNGPGQ